MNTGQGKTQPRGREQNNLDVIRFVAASGVMVSHSFPLAIGRGAREPLEDFTRGQSSLGRVCVAVFFVLSGLLITRSYERTASPGRYLWARALRILPGLLVMLLLTILVLGPLLTSLPWARYFSSPEPYRYLVKNLTLYEPSWTLPGVFDHNAYPGAVNGSLWTLKYEVGFYLLVAALGAVRGLRWPVVGALWVLSAGMTVAGVGELWPEMFLYFGGGMALHLMGDRVRWNTPLVLLGVAALVATARLGVGFHIAVAVGGAYLLHLLAFGSLTWGSFARRGDLSYGIYIYGFPVQQLVTAALGGQTRWWVNVAAAFPLVLLLAFASWHLVEKRALRLKGLWAKGSAE
jgi:peptidoglycan/LPS O-acetylase OafA/YrhL